MISLSRITSAESDLTTLESVRENFRNHLLTALSEAREVTLKMEPRFRDVLLDALTKEFHPDQHASDLLTDAFHDAEELLTEHVDELKDELAYAHRRAGIAAE